eukprot:5331532-Amphidinium_carterae.1
MDRLFANTTPHQSAHCIANSYSHERLGGKVPAAKQHPQNHPNNSHTTPRVLRSGLVLSRNSCIVLAISIAKRASSPIKVDVNGTSAK